MYVGNCLILSVISTTTIFAASHRFLSITNTYESIFFNIYVHLFTTNSLFLFSSCIEICLVVERILYLVPTRFKRIKLISFKKFFSILFVASLLVNVPGHFIFEPAFADVQLDQNKTFRIWYLGLTPFSNTLIGGISNYFGYIFRDLLPMFLKIVLNSLSVYLVRRYVKNKRKIRAATLEATSEMVNFDRNQTYVAFLMSSLSLFEHVLYIVSYVLYFINNYYLSTVLFVVAFLFISIKHLLFFFILLFFNNLFRSEVKCCFKRVLGFSESQNI